MDSIITSIPPLSSPALKNVARILGALGKGAVGGPDQPPHGPTQPALPSGTALHPMYHNLSIKEYKGITHVVFSTIFTSLIILNRYLKKIEQKNMNIEYEK